MALSNVEVFTSFRLILRYYRIITIEENKKTEFVSFEYLLFGNDENIARIRKSKHFFI